MGGSAGDQRRQQIRRELNCCLQLCTLRFGSRFHLPPPAVEFSSRRPGPGTTTITVSADVAPALRHTTPDTRHRSTIPTRVLLRSIPSGDLDTATYNWPALSRRHWHLCWRKPSTRLRHLVTRQATSYPGADGSIDCYCKTPQSSNTDPSLEQLQPDQACGERKAARYAFFVLAPRPHCSAAARNLPPDCASLGIR